MPTLEGAEKSTGNEKLATDKGRKKQCTHGTINDTAILLLARKYTQDFYACR